MKQQNSETCYW